MASVVPFDSLGFRSLVLLLLLLRNYGSLDAVYSPEEYIRDVSYCLKRDHKYIVKSNYDSQRQRFGAISFTFFSSFK